MELKLKHVAPYLPYGLKMRFKNEKDTYTLIGLRSPFKTNDKCFLSAEIRFEKTIKIRSEVFNRGENNLKPILKPLSELNQEGEIHTPEYIQSCTYQYVQHLLKNHYDIYGLIEKGLAIDINTL